MAGPKSIQLPGVAASAIQAVEQLAAKDSISLGAAAAQLIERGMSTADPSPVDASPTPFDPTFFSVDELIAELRGRLKAPRADPEVLRAAEDRAESAERRAVEAEERATAAEQKLEAVRAAFG